MAKKERDVKGKQYRAAKPGAGKDAGPAQKPKPKSRRARRIVEAREPKVVEDPKKALLLYGGRTSQTVKDVLSDFGKLKGLEAVKLTRKNAEVKPFEAGGEGQLEHLGRRADAALFALGTSTKKRPHNLTLGRFFDGRLYDMLELGVEKYTSIRDFGRAAEVQIGNKPAIVFAGELFEKEPALGQARSLLLDFFRGRQISNVALKGLDRVMCVAAADASLLLLRQFRIHLKKTGTKLPRVELQEMGPRLDLAVRRRQEAPPDVAREAHKLAKTTAKKEKNVSQDELAGKVGRIYMPAQDVGSLALHKMKGVKRERRASASDAKAAKRKKGGSQSLADAAAADAEDSGGELVDMTDI